MAAAPACHICGRRALAECARCHAAAYCGPECQRLDWRRHRPGCLGRTSEGVGVASAPTPSAARAGGSAASAAKPAGVGAAPPAAAAVGARPSFAAAPPSAAVCRSLSGEPGPPAAFDVVLTGERSVEKAGQVVECLRRRGVCVIKAGADRSFHRALLMEAKQLWEAGSFEEAKKGQPVVPGSDQIRYDARDDKVVWMSSDWTKQNEKRCRALKVLDGQLGDFGVGLSQMLDEQLGLTIKRRTVGMLSCYDGAAAPGARYDYHIDNPYQTAMDVPDDKRRLTLLYYITEGPWDVKEDGGGLQVCLTDPRRAPRTASEAMGAERLTVAPECDTMVAFFSHTMYHAVLPMAAPRRRFALSTWFQCP